MKKTFSGIMLTLLLLGAFTFVFDVQPVEASGTIYIKADGSIVPSANITTTDNVTYYFTGNNYDEIVVERSNIIIDGNGYTLSGSGSGYGFNLASINNVTIQNTNIKNFYYGIYVYQSSFNTVSGNNITNNRYHGIELWWYSSYNSISGNRITNNGIGVHLCSSSFNSVSGNTIANNNAIGVYFYWISSNNSVSENNITSNGCGVDLQEFSNNNTVFRNAITNNQAWGFRFQWSFNNTVSGNSITNNGDYGIWLYYPSSNNTICGNNITNHTYGIWLDSYFNTFSGNTITNNEVGVYLDEANNRFFHNNFIDNARQVYIRTPGYANFWDDGYPSGGNYWSDFKGRYPDVEDVYSGPYQNETGSDRIWDHPYVFDANNQDNYPYMNKDGWKTPIIQVPVVRGGLRYDVTIESNATLTHVVATKTTLHFKATGPPGQTAYIKVTMPVGLNTTEIKVFIDGEWLQPPPWPEITTNGTHYFIYLEFTLSTKTITIQYSTLINSTPHINPNTLNLISEGEWITCYIELPEDHDVNDINIATVMLNDIVPAELDPTEIGDYDGDGVPDLMVKFDRESVIEYVEGNLGELNPERTKPLIYQVTLTVTGLMTDGTQFEGSDTIRVLKFLKGQPTPN